MSEPRTTKEAAYDEHISPLMSQIIKLCKEHKINMAADFCLGFDPSEDRDLFCTTILPVDKSDTVGTDRIERVRGCLYAAPQLIAFTITSGERAP